MNVLAIASTIAARFLPENVTPPAGYQNIRVSTARIGESIQPPSVLVYMPEAEVTNFVAQTRTTVLTFPVRFHYITTPLARGEESDGLYAWAAVLIDQLVGKVQLSGAPVAQGYTSGWRMAEFDYDGQGYVGIEMDVSVTVSEGVSPTA